MTIQPLRGVAYHWYGDVRFETWPPRTEAGVGGLLLAMKLSQRHNHPDKRFDSIQLQNRFLVMTLVQNS